MSEVKTNKISPATGTTITIGDSGDTVTLGSGASASGFTSGIVGVSIFTSSGTWTKATREAALGVTIKKVIVEVQGAGGAGTKSTTGGNYNGGGGGGYARKLIDVSSISTSTITIGSGGVGSTSVNTKGTDGGDSIWSDGTNTITGFGGGAGETSGYEGGLGGAATGGDLNVDGGIARMDNQGGHTFLGFGAQTQYAASRTDGLNGTLGGGGAGVYSTYPSAAKAGDGGDGIVIVTEIAG